MYIYSKTGITTFTRKIKLNTRSLSLSLTLNTLNKAKYSFTLSFTLVGVG